MNKLIQKLHNNWRQVAISLFLAAAVCGCSSDHIEDFTPCPIPPSIFSLGEEDVILSAAGGTVVIEPFGEKGQDFLPLAYIATIPFVEFHNAVSYVKAGHVGGIPIADFYDVFSVLDENRSNGITGYINSDRVVYEYEWVKVKCYKSPNDTNTKLEITAAPNPDKKGRHMYLYFVEPELGSVAVFQEAIP